MCQNEFKKEIPSSLSSEYPQNTCWPNRSSLLQNWSSEIFLLFLRSFDRPNFPIERLFKLLLCHRHQKIAESDNNSSLEFVQEGLEADHINGSDRKSMERWRRRPRPTYDRRDLLIVTPGVILRSNTLYWDICNIWTDTLNSTSYLKRMRGHILFWILSY